MHNRSVFLNSFRTVLCIAVFLSSALQAQELKFSAPQELLNRLPGGLDRHAAALGKRMLEAGKERSVLAGTLTGVRGESMPLRVILQLPSLVRIEGLRSDNSPLVFDGKTGVYPNSRLEEELLEIFSSDFPEGMLASVTEGAAIQLLGRGVVSVADNKRMESRRYFDVYEVGAAIRASARQLERLKQYYFDSESGLLVRTQYIDAEFSPPLEIETHFSDWRIQDGSAYPTRIERHENGRSVFSLTVTSVIALPRLDPTNFVSSVQRGQQEE